MKSSLGLFVAALTLGSHCVLAFVPHAVLPVSSRMGPTSQNYALERQMKPSASAPLFTLGRHAPLPLIGKRSTKRTDAKMSLAMIPSVIASSSILGGALAGGLHAVSGPDHFPALLPRCVGKRWLAAGKIGAIWGLGHAISAMGMGLMAFLVKDKAFASGHFVSKVAFGADIAIGLSLILIGFLSIAESKNVDFSAQVVEARSKEKQTLAMKANVLINGVFHGLAIDGIPTLMPVLGLGSLNSAISFLVAYGVGVIAAMVAATVFIGQGTMSLAKTTEFDLSKIVKGSAVAAIIIGIAWTARALFFQA